MPLADRVPVFSNLTLVSAAGKLRSRAIHQRVGRNRHACMDERGVSVILPLGLYAPALIFFQPSGTTPLRFICLFGKGHQFEVGGLERHGKLALRLLGQTSAVGLLRRIVEEGQHDAARAISVRLEPWPARGTLK